MKDQIIYAFRVKARGANLAILRRPIGMTVKGLQAVLPSGVQHKLLSILYRLLQGVYQFFQAGIKRVVLSNDTGQVVCIDAIGTEGSFLPAFNFTGTPHVFSLVPGPQKTTQEKQAAEASSQDAPCRQTAYPLPNTNPTAWLESH